MRAWARFWVPLKSERRCICAPNTLQGTVKQGLVAYHQVVGQGAFINRKPMVLTGDMHYLGRQILHRVIGAVVAKLHLLSFST